ncbi:hypothetical protein Leryth_026415 [Lithospermum erythrorhizon]|nr:hypothetical protein Leryth_026415 [Lithospermum erythrorhizon]
MPVLRSGNVTTPVNLKPMPASLENGCFEPSTPVKTPEILNQKTDNSTSSSMLQDSGKELGSVSEGKSVPTTRSGSRRSLRLAEKTAVGLNSPRENVDHSTRKRKDVSPKDGSQLGNSENNSVGDGESNVLCMSGKRIRVTEKVGGEICHSGDTVQLPAKGAKVSLEGLPGSGVSSGKISEGLESEEKGKGKRRTSIENDGKFLNLRSGKRSSKRIMEERGDLNAHESSIQDEQVVVNTDLSPNVLDQGVGEVNKLGVENRNRGKLVDNNILSNGFHTLDQRLENVDGANNFGVRTRSRLGRLDKGKGKIVDNDTSEVIAVGVETRFRKNCLEKGKGKMIELDYSMSNSDASGSIFEPNPQNTTECNVSDGASPMENVPLQEDNNVPGETRSLRERFRDLAKQNASRFAHFVAEDEDNSVVDDTVGDNSPSEDRNVEDWPGFFSTAMKIIKDRETNKKMQQQNSSTGKTKPLSKWVPKRDQQYDCRKRFVPSLQDICWPVLVNNAEAITSLDFIPDVLKHKLSQLLCDCRRMNCHVLELIVRGSPTEIRVRECSWLTEESFTRIFERCDTSNLTVLQLDLCGSCLADYILYTTFAGSPNSLPALANISLKGAYRLSDTGLSTLVTSAPSLRSINLSQCSLLTSDGINGLADSLGHVLRELYIDECQGIDAKLILPALLKLPHLEVLSVASIETVTDSFVVNFVTAQGHSMKELILKDCMKLTNSSVKAIAENCPRLCSIDLRSLHKLTDAALGYLANGCRTIHTLKLGRHSFSDEAVAAYIETCGDSLKELSLNYLTKVADNTAVSLAKCSKILHTLDLSFCRNISNEDLGLIVDSCSSLRVLKLFGCSQVGDVFLCGHSNLHVQIIGLKMTSVVQHLKDPVLPRGSACY